MTEIKILDPEVGDLNFDDNFKETIYKKGKSLKIEKLEKLYTGMDIYVPKVGEKREVVYQGTRGGYYVFSDKNMKDDIRVDIKQSESKYLVNSEIGTTVELLITDISNREYLIKGSIASIHEDNAHQSIMDLDDDEYVNATVIDITPAGYIMEITKNDVILQGFMPNTLAGVNRIHNPESMIGRDIKAMVESYSEYEGTYILNRKRYLQSLIPQAIEEIRNADKYTLYEGIVTGTIPNGIFVEFNECLTGMVHRLNVNDAWKDRIDEINPGRAIEFYVKDINVHKDPSKTRIVLSQIIRETLWDVVEVGHVLEGTVISNKPFGTLVWLDEETRGLISSKNTESFKGDLIPGEKIEVKVSHVDRNERKLSLVKP